MKYRELYVHHPEDAVKALRKEMEDYLRDITLSFSSWEDRLFIERLMELWICQTPSELLLDRHNQLLKWKRILENTFVLPEEKGDWELLRKRVKRIHTTLEISGLTSRDIFAEHSEGSYQKMVVKLTPLLFFWLPLMLVGYVFWWIPTKIIQYATAKGTKGHRDIVATYHVVGAFILYPLWMAFFFLITPWFADFKAMLVLGSLLIFCGYAVLAAARKIRVGFKEILNMYRYGSLQNMLIDLRSETHQVWSLAARLWNRGLSRQASLE